jgi:glycosyltransferase involved in cell wall biosynthesis
LAILQPAAELGGAERSLLTLLRACKKGALEATVILPRRGPLLDELSSLGVAARVIEQPAALLRQSRRPDAATVVRAATLPFLLPPYVARLAATIRQQLPDVLYSNGIKTHFLSAVLGPWLGLPVVWHVRDFYGGPLLPRLADRVPVRIIANSQAVADHLARCMRHPEKIAVVHNAVDTTAFSPEGPRAEAAMRIPATFRVGLPSVLAQWKGHSVLLAAVEQIRASVPGTIFFLIGGPVYDTVREHGYEQQLLRDIERRRLQDSVIVTGFQKDMPPWYRAMDVIVHASTKPEPFGRTVLEAMACGHPIVATRAGGIPEFVTHGETGLLYPMGDANGLADSVITLLRSPDLRRRLSVAARQAVMQHFDAETHATKIATILRAVARSHRPNSN